MAKRSKDQERDFALGRVIAIVNDKGGVGKTSIAANLAGQFAGADYRCLLIDLNRQANLADDLGYRGSDADDQGAGCWAASSPARRSPRRWTCVRSWTWCVGARGSRT